MSRCQLCNGKGFTIRFNPETKEDTAYPCECWLKRNEDTHRKTMLIKACIPPKYWEYSLETYLMLPWGESVVTSANAPNIRKLRKLIEDKNERLAFLKEFNVLWIWGRCPNAGHTSLAVILAIELLKHKHKVRFIRMQDLIAAFTDFDNKKEFFKNLENFDIYLLDDAFDENRCIVSGDYTNINVYNWLSVAISNKKHFICTSKIDIPQIGEKFEQSKHVLLKARVSLEIQGTLRIA